MEKMNEQSVKDGTIQASSMVCHDRVELGTIEKRREKRLKGGSGKQLLCDGYLIMTWEGNDGYNGGVVVAILKRKREVK